MSMSEYEERFRPQTPSLHQVFAAARGPKSERRGNLRLWVAAALVGVMTMTCKVGVSSYRSPWNSRWLAGMGFRDPMTR